MEYMGSHSTPTSLEIRDHRVQRTSWVIYGLTAIAAGLSLAEGAWLWYLTGFLALMSLYRLAAIETVSIVRTPPTLRLTRGRIWPHETDVSLGDGIYVQSRGQVILFFKEGREETPIARVHRRDEYDSLETIERIQRFLNGENVPERLYPSTPKILTWTLVVLNVGVFLLDLSLNHELLENGFLSRAAVVAGEPWRIWTSMFLHAGFAHILMNMMAAASLLSFLETHVGWKKTLVGYFLSGTCAGIWALLWLGSKPMVGASGAIFGLLGMITWLAYKGKIYGWNPEMLPSRGQITQMIGINLIISLLPSISLAAHFGGFVGGWGFAALALSRRKAPN